MRFGGLPEGTGVFPAVPPNGISYAEHLDSGSTDDKKDTDEERRSIGSRGRCATRLARHNIIELHGGLRGTRRCAIMNVCGAVPLQRNVLTPRLHRFLSGK